jgi:uncharacterized protein YecE (DUF72 family)
VEKQRVVTVLKEIGDLLEIAEANAFEVMAYRNAARSLDSFDGDLEGAVAGGTLTKLHGVGKGIARVVTDLVSDGRSPEHDAIRGRFPAGLPELLGLPGIGPKKVKALYGELGVSDLEALETAARASKVSALRGFGKKTEERILAAIERRREHAGSPAKRRQAPSVKRRPARPRPSPAPSARRTGTGRLLVGTSGFSYKAWKGSFYPEDLPAGRFLEHYATRLPTVEINNSFYRFPSEGALAGWSEKTPPGFRFAVKANQRITHRMRLRQVEEVTANFVQRCRILGERLGPILVQLPPNLKRDDALLEDFLACLPNEARYAMEFRHESWFHDAVFGRLASAGVALVVSDDEKLGTPREATADLVYVRLRRDGYDEAALEDLGAWFAEQTADGRDVYAYLKHKAASSPEAILGRWLGAPARKTATSRRRASARRKKQA